MGSIDDIGALVDMLRSVFAEDASVPRHLLTLVRHCGSFTRFIFLSRPLTHSRTHAHLQGESRDEQGQLSFDETVAFTYNTLPVEPVEVFLGPKK